MAEESPQPPEPRKKRRRHRLLWTLAVFVLLLAVVATAVQVVLWTNVPRRVVISQVEKNLGLRLDAAALKTSWLGNTTLHNVELGLPLSDKAFLKVPTMKVRTNSLFGLALGSGISVRSIELYQPTLYVVQDSAGNWNLQQVAELVAGVLGKKPAEAKNQAAIPSVPNVKIVDATLVVLDNQQRSSTIQPIELQGYAETPLSWAYNLHIQPDPNQPPRVGLKGRLAPGGNWKHEVELGVQNISDWIKPWNSSPPVVNLAMTWNGQLSSSGVGGRLEIHKAQVGLAEAYGVVNASQAGSEIRIVPNHLLLKTEQHIVPQVSLNAGALVYNGSELQIQQLLMTIFGGAVKVDGSLNPKAKSAQIVAQWQQLQLGKAVKANGNLRISASAPLPNQTLLSIQADTNGTAASGPWEAKVDLNSKGSNWGNMSWNLSLPVLQWHRTVPFKLDGLAMTGDVHSKDEDGHAVPVLTLASANLPIPNLVAAHGSYTFDKNQIWSLHVEGRNWEFRPLNDTLVSFVFDGHGDHAAAKLDNLGIKGADTTVSMNGIYTYGVPKPVKAALTLTNTQPMNPVTDSQPAPQLLRGTVTGNADLEGELAPMNLSIRGTLRGREVDVRKYHIGDMVMALTGTADGDEVKLQTNQLRLLGGDWQFQGDYALDTDNIDLGLTIKNVAMKDVAAVVNLGGLSGSFNSQLNVHVPGLQFNPNAIEATTSGSLNDVRALDMDLADAVTFKAALSKGQLEVKPVHIQRGKGSGDVTASINVNDPYQINSSIAINNWQLDLPAAKLHADVSVAAPDLRIELPRKARKPKTLQIPGPSPKVAAETGATSEADAGKAQTFRAYAQQVDIRGDATLAGRPLCDLELYSAVWEQVLDVRAIHAHLLGGRADGQARLDFSKFTTSTAELSWANLDSTLLTAFYPSLKDFGGLMNGNLRLAPAEVPRPLEPLAFVIKTDFQGGHWRDVPVKDALIVGFIGKDELDPTGGYRIVLGSGDRETSTIHFDEGALRLWGRVGRHANSTFATQLNIGVENLQLDTLVHAYDKTAKPMPGRVTGTLAALFATPRAEMERALYPFPLQPPARHPTTTTAPSTQPATAPATQPMPESVEFEKVLMPLVLDGDVKLTNTNLAKFGPVAALYNMMNAGPGLDQPTGSGDVRFHLERGIFHVNHLRYFNKGVEVRATATVSRVWDLPDNPISGTAVGTLQPLKQKKLPLLADINDILAAIQRNLTTVAISGHVRKPDIKQMLFGDIGGEFRRFIVGDVNSELGNGE